MRDMRYSYITFKEIFILLLTILTRMCIIMKMRINSLKFLAAGEVIHPSFFCQVKYQKNDT